MYEKSPGIKKIINFKGAFVKRITRMVKPYDEEHIIFDCYDIAQSLKRKTRTKRAQGKDMEFAIHDEMEDYLQRAALCLEGKGAPFQHSW